ncbi:MAG: amidase family protein [Oscillospiraceae bacterium]|nr:amidase family protein [Oscillospiraceae bacterium]
MGHFVNKYNVDCPKGAVRVILDGSIMHKGQPVTAGSKMLEGFISPITATAVTKLEKADIVIVGSAKMDEFGVRGLFLTDKHDTIVCEAVEAIASGAADVALCNDYTGAIGAAAAAQNLFYMHPTYGSVSRYGLISAVPSMDQIGVVCKSIEAGAHILSIISGFDEQDGVMLCKDQPTGASGAGKLRVGMPHGMGEMVSQSVSAIFDSCDTVEIALEHFDVCEQVMHILCCAELSASISRYDGIKFGFRAEKYSDLEALYKKSRTEALGADVKFAAIVGAMVLSEGNYSKYYDHAMRIRRRMKNALDFQEYDAVLAPNAHLARLCGLPAVTMPSDAGALTLIANAGCEETLYSILRKS